MRKLIIVHQGLLPVRKLCLATGWGPQQLFRLAECVFISQWDIVNARAQAIDVFESNKDGVIVILGKQVAKAFDHHGDYFCSCSNLGRLLVTIPATWNNVQTQRKVGNTLKTMHAVTQHTW